MKYILCGISSHCPLMSRINLRDYVESTQWKDQDGLFYPDLVRIKEQKTSQLESTSLWPPTRKAVYPVAGAMEGYSRPEFDPTPSESLALRRQRLPAHIREHDKGHIDRSSTLVGVYPVGSAHSGRFDSREAVRERLTHLQQRLQTGVAGSRQYAFLYDAKDSLSSRIRASYCN